ncbi:MAG: leucine-rich repeat domain-containing protein [Prevotella sp.]|nr:leucine-rich repeat domain-containing protein [Prevotella sp.]
MKKLFTSLLLLGAVTVTQAQEVNPVSVTSFEGGVLTVNYNERLGETSEHKVNQALHQWRDSYFTDVQGGPAEKDAAMKAAVQTIKLTGDWSNHDLKKDNKTIFNLVEKLGEQNVGVGLDLSSCQKMTCEFVSVTESYDDISMDGTVTFTYTPTGDSQTYSNEVKVTPHQNEVQETTVYKVWGSICDPFSNPAVFPENTLSNNPVEYIQKDGKWYVVFEAGWTAEIQEETAYSYLDENTETVTVNLNTLQNNSDKYQQIDGTWYYCYTTYDYKDKYGTDISTVNKHDPYNLKENYDDQGNMYYTYEYTITTDGFSFDGYVSQLSSVSFPNHANFTFIPNNLLQSSNSLTSVTLPASLRAIGNHAFASASQLTQVNFPDNLEEIGGGAFENTRIPAVDLSNTKVTVIRWCTFMKNPALQTVTFPTAITLIEYNAFLEDKKLEYVDLSQCHKLRLISVGAFGDCCDQGNGTGIKWVEICSHPKILRGNGHGTGCFNNDKFIERVEIKACYTPDDPITDITQCYCEIGAFDYDITEVQTQIDNVPKGAKLIFPNDMPVGNNQTYAGITRQSPAVEQGSAYTNPYTSAFDFFVGDYKAGVLLSQSSLQVFYDDVPNNLGPAAGYGAPVDQPTLGDYVEGVANGEVKVVGDTRYSYNGWMEFINTDFGQVIPKGEFLRTYSRSFGDGPCLLPKEITAYRAVDYKSTKVGFVKDKKNGTYFCTDETKAVENRTDDDYVLIASLSEEELAQYPSNQPRYSKLTIGGILYLRPLVAKVAEYPLTGPEEDRTIGYTDDNKDYFDSEAIYSQLQAVPGGYSYVPENTGVVLYSTSIDEKSFLVLGGDFGTENVYKEFPHTGDRYEEGRLTSSNTDNDINMLHGSYGEGWPVAPVFPWTYKNSSTYSGGHYGDPKEYRNFACVKLGTKEEVQNGTTLEKGIFGWQRLQPSLMKENRAFAQIPTNRFDNHNEGVDQMPDFTITDMPTTDTQQTDEGTTSNDGNMMVLTIIDDEYEDGAVIDGIKTVNTNVVKTDNNAWYTIQGVRVAQPTKGVYIHNGQKVVIK